MFSWFRIKSIEERSKVPKYKDQFCHYLDLHSATFMVTLTQDNRRS